MVPAAFVTCSAAGMALGPLLAVPMARVPTVQLGFITFNSITAGAYVMSLIWLVFLAVTIFCFEEPPIRYHIRPCQCGSLAVQNSIRQIRLGTGR